MNNDMTVWHGLMSGREWTSRRKTSEATDYRFDLGKETNTRPDENALCGVHTIHSQRKRRKLYKELILLY